MPPTAVDLAPAFRRAWRTRGPPTENPSSSTPTGRRPPAKQPTAAMLCVHRLTVGVVQDRVQQAERPPSNGQWAAEADREYMASDVARRLFHSPEESNQAVRAKPAEWRSGRVAT